MLVGIVGKPSCGKSTFFKALTLADVAIASYPFTTIKPNEGVSFVRVQCVDKELGVQCNPREGYCANGTRFVPVKLLDVAGLVPGAHAGKGLGLQFLDDLRQADVLIHVVDMAGATNERGEPVTPGTYDPAFDIRFLEVELDMWYLSILTKGWERFARKVQQEHGNIAKGLGEQLSGLNVNDKMVEDAMKKLNLDPAMPTSWTEEQLHKLSTDLRKRTKPMLIAGNKMDIPVAHENLKRLQEQFPEYIIVPCSADTELALKEAAKAGLIDYVPGNSGFEVKGTLNAGQSKGLEFIRSLLGHYGSTGVQQVLDAAVFQLLGYLAIFPGGIGKLGDQYGRILPDCFLLPRNSTALDFAFKIHSDLGNKFIRAIDVKTRKTVGKEHLLKHRDVVEIVSGK